MISRLLAVVDSLESGDGRVTESGHTGGQLAHAVVAHDAGQTTVTTGRGTNELELFRFIAEQRESGPPADLATPEEAYMVLLDQLEQLIEGDDS